MKRLGLMLFLLAIASMLSGSALAQNVGDKSVYLTTYYSNANVYYETDTSKVVSKKLATAFLAAPDATLRIVNDGDTGSTLYASIYVFDDSQELQDCCSCAVSPDGLLSESVDSQLANYDYVLTPKLNFTGVVKVISSSVPAGPPYASASSGPSSFTNTPTPGLHGSMTHVQSGANGYPFGLPPYFQTEAALADSNLSASEKSMLEGLCFYAQQLGSGFGACTCTTEDYDF